MVPDQTSLPGLATALPVNSIRRQGVPPPCQGGRRYLGPGQGLSRPLCVPVSGAAVAAQLHRQAEGFQRGIPRLTIDIRIGKTDR